MMSVSEKIRINATAYLIAMISVTNTLPFVTTAPIQVSQCAKMAACVLRIHIFVMELLTVLMALTSLMFGQIVPIVMKKTLSYAQDSLTTVPFFVMEMQLVQMVGMNYCPHAMQKHFLEKT